MSKPLPVLASVPHAGLEVPEEVESLCVLSRRQIVADGDEHAAEVYDIAGDVAAFCTTHVARAVVDLNRAEDDRRPDGVVKTHTCFNEPVYRKPLDDKVIDKLLDRYHRPYHSQLRSLAGEGLRLAVDCHTMLAVGPPIGPGAGIERPHVCLGDGGGACPPRWMACLEESFREAFGPSVTVNQPFSGGYITRSHGAEMPWFQLELSRGPFLSNSEKRSRVVAALQGGLLRIASIPG